MGASIITGFTGTRHITPEMDGAVYRGIIGDESYILSEGDQCEGSMPSVNQFTVKSGVVSIQGRQVYVTQETLSIDTCPTGYKRIDLICVRFEHDTTSLIDQASLVVIKGAEVSGGNDPIEPAHNEGIIKDGATVVDFVMYRLDFDGASVEISQPSTVKSSLNHLDDMAIVEQGTSGDWMYRKYANGFAECFARFAPSSKQGTSYGGMYYAEYAVNSQFPFTFTETPILLITPSSAAWGMIGDVTYTNAKLTKYDTYRGNGGTVSGAVSVHVFGKWQ